MKYKNACIVMQKSVANLQRRAKFIYTEKISRAAMFKILLLAASVMLLCKLSTGLSSPEDTQATITKYKNEINLDGSYNYEYGTSNNIEGSETGVGGAYAQGAYSYTAPDGQIIQLAYTADVNGYKPEGDHIPTPPPIPDYILRGLAYIEAHPFDRIQLKRI